MGLPCDPGICTAHYRIKRSYQYHRLNRGTLSSATWGPYSMSKHAMEAFNDALADEMKRFGVKVSLIRAGYLPVKNRNKRG